MTMTHPYYIAKARAAFTAVGWNPDDSSELAEWGAGLVRYPRTLVAGVIVARDGSIIDTNAGCDAPLLAGLAEELAQPVAHFTPSDFTGRSAGVKATMSAAEFVAIRELLGLKVDDLAAALGVHSQTPRKWANGSEGVSASGEAGMLALLAVHTEHARVAAKRRRLEVPREDGWVVAVAGRAKALNPALMIEWA